MKPWTAMVAVILAVVSVLHLLRLLLGVPVMVYDSAVPMWVSVLGFVVAGVFALMLWREARR